MKTTGNQPHIRAEITFLRTTEGGRQGPARSGQRSKFYYDGYDWDVTLTFPNREWVYPGDTTTAVLTFLTPENHHGQLYVGKEFEIREATHVVARGRVTKLLALE